MAKVSQQIIKFSKDNINFLLLNILGHDVIHDFYGNLGKERWNKVSSLVNKFKSSFTMSGGTITTTLTERPPKRTRDDTDTDTGYKSKRVFVNNGSNIYYLSESPNHLQRENISFNDLGQGKILGERITIYELFNDKEYSEFCSDIGNDIQFKLFYVVSNLIYNNKITGLNEMLNITSSHDFFIPNDLKKVNETDNTPELKTKLYSTLRDRFIEYYFDYFIDNKNDYMDVVTEPFIDRETNEYPELTYTEMFNLVYNFITDDYYFSYTIYKFLISNPFQKGGENTELTPDENSEFIMAMNKKKADMEKENGIITDMANIFLKKNENTEEKSRKYTQYKKMCLDEFKSIIRDEKYRQDTLAGDFDNFLLPSFETASKLIRSFTEDLNAKYNKLMKYYKDIEKKERTKLAGSTLKVKSPAYDVKESFAFIILKGSLYLTECVDKNQQPIINIITPEENDLIRRQINIINEIKTNNFISDEHKRELIEIVSTIKVNNKFILPYIKEYIIFQTVLNINKDIDYDNYLIEYIKNIFAQYEYNNESNQRYECIDENNNYVINNAANLSRFSKKYLNEKVFCPYSSILDAMPQCKYNDSVKKHIIEYGDINFKLFNIDSNVYYNGMSQIVKQDDNIFSKTILEIKLPLLTINSVIDVPVNYNGRSELSAEDSLRSTLLDMINFINVQERPVLDKIFKEKQIFENLYDMATQEALDFQTGAEISKINFDYPDFKMDPNVNANLNIFSVVFNKILIKGTGDLYQEINSVCKYGGYVGDNYYCDENILSYNTSSGNQTRFFAANDRPSASRFIFILCNGDENEINTKSLGGYISQADHFIVSKYTNPKYIHPNPCEFEPQIMISSGGKSKRHKNKKNRKTKNIRINKKSKLYTIKRKYKKNNKTRRIK